MSKVAAVTARNLHHLVVEMVLEEVEVRPYRNRNSVAVEETSGSWKISVFHGKVSQLKERRADARYLQRDGRNPSREDRVTLPTQNYSPSI